MNQNNCLLTAWIRFSLAAEIQPQAGLNLASSDCSTADGVDLSCLEFEKQAVSCAFFTLMLIKNLTFWEVSVLVHPRVL